MRAKSVGKVLNFQYSYPNSYLAENTSQIPEYQYPGIDTQVSVTGIDTRLFQRFFFINLTFLQEIENTKSKTRNRKLEIENSKLKTRNQSSKSKTGKRKLEIKNSKSKPEIENSTAKTRNRKLEIENSKSKTRNRKLDFLMKISKIHIPGYYIIIPRYFLPTLDKIINKIIQMEMFSHMTCFFPGVDTQKDKNTFSDFSRNFFNYLFTQISMDEKQIGKIFI